MSKLTRLLVAAAAGVTVAVMLPGAGGAQETVLNGVVGPGFTIRLTDAAGNRVDRLSPGTYTVVVQDRSEDHNFHLVGPGVDQETEVGFVGTVTWTITVTNGTYRYVCDPHASTMRGSFAVGPPPPTKPAGPPKLQGRVGPGRTIWLRSGATRVRTLPAGAYRVTVRDMTRTDNFHLLGRGVNRKTGIRFRGMATWTVTLTAGRTYRYRSDARPRLGGSFRVVAAAT